jgi:hypothetical protein
MNKPMSAGRTAVELTHEKEDSGFVIYRLEEAAATRLRPPIPSAARISRMDEALGWIPLIPRDRYVLRRIVGARCLVSPITERHLYSWRRIGDLLGADHKAVQRWHAQAIDMLVAAIGALHVGEARKQRSS